MAIEFRSLLEEAFFTDEASRATAAIEQARAGVRAAGKLAAFNLEVVMPDQPDEGWLREYVVRPLIYFCQSTGATPPACPGVFITFFHGDRLSCVLAAEVIAWSAQQLHTDEQSLIDEYGTGEVDHGAPRTV